MVFAILIWIGIIIGSGFGVLWGIGSLLMGFDRYEEERAIRTTPVASLDSVAVGPTAIEGEVHPVDREVGTLYGCDRCVAYDLSVSDTGSDTSETHVEKAYTVPFDIADDGGSIRVRETEFDFQVSEDRQWDEERKSHESSDEELSQFERNWEIPPLRSGDTRYYEASYLCPGDTVYAYGTLELDESRIDTTDAEKPLVLTDRDELCFISDKSPEELLRERRFALAKAGGLGILVSVLSLTVFLWVTGIAQIFLGV